MWGAKRTQRRRGACAQPSASGLVGWGCLNFKLLLVEGAKPTLISSDHRFGCTVSTQGVILSDVVALLAGAGRPSHAGVGGESLAQGGGGGGVHRRQQPQDSKDQRGRWYHRMNQNLTRGRNEWLPLAKQKAERMRQRTHRPDAGFDQAPARTPEEALSAKPRTRGRPDASPFNPFRVE